MISDLHNEIVSRFPEVRRSILPGDEELPYVMMSHLVTWLKSLPGPHLCPEVVNQVVAFVQSCEDQPHGAKSENDMLTVLTVGFFEKLFDAPTTRALLPKLISRGDMSANEKYWRAWVDSANYDKALNLYRRNT